MTLPIEQIAVHRGSIPVNLSFSYGEVSEFNFLIVRILAGGKEGVGETLLPDNRFPDAWFQNWASKLVGADAQKLDALVPDWKTESPRR